MVGNGPGRDDLIPTETAPSWRTMMRAKILAGLLGGTLLASTAIAADNGKLSLSQAVKLGDRDAVSSLLKGRTTEDVAKEGTTALLAAVTRNDLEMIDLLLRAGADPKSANEYGATALYG